MAWELAFLTLAIHLAQATTCQGDNCPTGDSNLELTSKIIAFDPNKVQWKCSIVVCTAFLLQHSLQPEEMELQQAVKPSHLQPTAPSLLFLTVTSHPSHPLILLPREKVPLPFCRWKQTEADCLRRERHWDFLYLLAQGARWLDSLRNVEVKSDHLIISTPFQPGKVFACSSCVANNRRGQDLPRWRPTRQQQHQWDSQWRFAEIGNYFNITCFV